MTVQVEHTATISHGSDDYKFHLDKRGEKDVKLDGITVRTLGFGKAIPIHWGDVPVSVQNDLMDYFPDGTVIHTWPHTGSALDIVHDTLRDLKAGKAPITPFTENDGYVRPRYIRLFTAVAGLDQSQAKRLIDECVEYAKR